MPISKGKKRKSKIFRWKKQAEGYIVIDNDGIEYVVPNSEAKKFSEVSTRMELDSTCTQYLNQFLGGE